MRWAEKRSIVATDPHTNFRPSAGLRRRGPLDVCRRHDDAAVPALSKDSGLDPNQSQRLTRLLTSISSRFRVWRETLGCARTTSPWIADLCFGIRPGIGCGLPMFAVTMVAGRSAANGALLSVAVMRKICSWEKSWRAR